MLEGTDNSRGMTTPGAYGDKPLPKRNGTKGMLPSTWLNRELRLEYVDTDGKAVRTSGVLLNYFPFGPVLNIAGAKTLLSWDRLCTVELVND